MHLIKRYISFIVLLLLTAIPSAAQDSILISVLTCSPGKDAYSHFGHTAIAVKDIARRTAIVYNYGCFDSRQKDFVLQFIKGNTNYKLDVEPYDFFLWRYQQDGVEVTEQILNLTDEEKLHLTSLLEENLKPENQTYLYNWLYDNCTERAFSTILNAINGSVTYPTPEPNVSIRELLHSKLTEAPWLALGIDMLLGAEIDEKYGATHNELCAQPLSLFLPSSLLSCLSDATVKTDSTERPLLLQQRILIPADASRVENAGWFTPNVMHWILLIIAAFSIYLDRTNRCLTIRSIRIPWTLFIDVPLYLAQGIAGIIITFLFFCSKHPAVDSNWLVLIFNPLPLLYIPYLIYVQIKGKPNKIATGMGIALLLICIAWISCPQQIPSEVSGFCTVLIIRAALQMQKEQRSKTEITSEK